MDDFRCPGGLPVHEQSGQWRGGSLDAMLLDEWDEWKQQLSRGTKQVLAAPTGTPHDKNANVRPDVAGGIQPKVESLTDDLRRPWDCLPESICTLPVSRASLSGGGVCRFRTPLLNENGSSPRKSEAREATEAGRSVDKMQIGRGTNRGNAGMVVASSLPNTSSPLRLRQLLAESILKARVAELSASHSKLQQKSYFNSWKESQTAAFALRSQAQNVESHFHLLKSFVEDLLDDVNDVNSIDALQRLKERYFTRGGREHDDGQQSPASTIFETASPLTNLSLSPTNGGLKEELSPSSKSEAPRSQSPGENIRFKSRASNGGLASWSRPQMASRYIPSLAQLRGQLLEAAENAAEHLSKEMERYKQRVHELENDVRNERRQRKNEVTALQELLEHLQLQLMQKNVLYDSLERRLSLRTVEWEKLEKTLTWQRNSLESDLEHKDEVVQDLRQSLVHSERSLQQQKAKCENLELTLRSQSEANACTAQINRELQSEVVRLKAEVQLLRENLDSIEREDVGETVRKYETQLQQMKKENEAQQSVLRRRIEVLQARASQIEHAEKMPTNGDISSSSSGHGASLSIGQGSESTESGQSTDTRSFTQETGSQPIRSPPPLLRISTVLRQSGPRGISAVDDASFAEVMPDDESSRAYSMRVQERTPAGTNIGKSGDSQSVDEQNSPAHCILMFESLQCACSDCNTLFETFKENWKKLEDELHISEATSAKYEVELAGVAQENETLRTRYERVVNSLEEVRAEALSAKLENSIKDQRLERLTQEDIKSQSLKEEIYHLQAEVRDTKAETSTLVKKVAELTMQNEELERALQEVCERNVRLSEITSKVPNKGNCLEVGVVTVSIRPQKNAKLHFERGSSQSIVRHAGDVIKVKDRGSADILHTVSGVGSLSSDSNTRGKVRPCHTETERILSRGHIDAIHHHLRSCVVDEKLRTLCIWLLGIYEQQIAKLQEVEKHLDKPIGEASQVSQSISHPNNSHAALLPSSKGNNFRSGAQIEKCSEDARALDQDDFGGVTLDSGPVKPDAQFRASQDLRSEQDQKHSLENVPSDWKSLSSGVSSPLPPAERTNCITLKALQQNTSRDGPGNGNLTTPLMEMSDSTTINSDVGPFSSENTTQNVVLFEEDSMILQPLTAAINGLSECASLTDSGSDLQPSTKTEQQTLKSPLRVSGGEQQTDPQQCVDSVTSSPGGSVIENFTLFDDEETCTLLAEASFESDVLKGDLDNNAWTEAAAPF